MVLTRFKKGLAAIVALPLFLLAIESTIAVRNAIQHPNQNKFYNTNREIDPSFLGFVPIYYFINKYEKRKHHS